MRNVSVIVQTTDTFARLTTVQERGWERSKYNLIFGIAHELRSSRGPNCADAGDSVATAMENVVPATVMIDPAMVERTAPP